MKKQGAGAKAKADARGMAAKKNGARGGMMRRRGGAPRVNGSRLTAMRTYVKRSARPGARGRAARPVRAKWKPPRHHWNVHGPFA